METNDFIAKVAHKISQLGLITPAILLLEAHKPLAFLGSQALLVAQPTLSLFLPTSLIHNTVTLFSQPDHMEQLISRLEQQATSPPLTPTPVIPEDAS